jgi:uncharacterized membrane protein YfcA
MISDPLFYAMAIPAVLLLGLGKGGFGGIGILALPLLSLVVPPVQAVAITLPILMVQDLVSVWAFRRDYSLENLKILMPGGCVGLTAGYFTAAHVSSAAVLILVGVISLAFVAYSVLRRAPANEPPQPPSWRKGSLWATVAGFTSFIANAGGPPYQVYIVPQKLPPKVYAGTGAIYFAIFNYTKFLAFMHLGFMPTDVLLTSAILFPLAIAATLGGVWLVKRVPLPVFYKIVYGLTFVMGCKLMWDGLRGLNLF